MAQFMMTSGPGMRGFSPQTGMTPNVQWNVTNEERKGHDVQFDQLGPSGGFLRGDQARVFFLKSNLPPAVLGQIWELADVTGDGKMDKLEFSIAMKLIKLKLQGTVLPTVLPLSMKQQPGAFSLSSYATPMSAYGGSTGTGSTLGSMGSSTLPYTMGPSMAVKSTMPNGSTGLSSLMPGMSGTLPPGFAGNKMMPTQPLASSGFGSANVAISNTPASVSVGSSSPASSSSASTDWAVPKPSKLKYNQLFNSHDIHKTGFLSGVQARFILTGTGLSHQALAQIWNLSDVDNDGKLTQEEFVLAMHLTDLAKSGSVIPSTLPPNLVPPSVRRAAAKTGAAGSALMGDITNLLEPEKNSTKDSESYTVFATFEDKRRDNFNKGNIELEKRRQALEESQRKERERLERKEREQRERREKERQDQERRRQAELERQLEKQRAAEREREEARKKVIEQREAAQREMERQRQLEWERIRRQELLQQKLREQEVVTGLHAKTKELDVEISALKEKKDQLGMRVSDVEAREKEQKMGIDAMNRSRDLKLAAVAKRQEELKGLNNMMNAVIPEKQSVMERLNQFKENQNSESHTSYRSNCDEKRLSMSRLRSSVEDNRKEAAAKLIRLESLNTQLNKLREELNKHRLGVEAMNRVQQDKVRDLQEARRVKEASLMRKNSMEKIKKQQQKVAAESFMKMKQLKEVTWDTPQNKQQENKVSMVQQLAKKVEQKENDEKQKATPDLRTDTRKLAEDEIKKEDVKRRIAEMQQKRLEQKKLQEPTYAAINKPPKNQVQKETPLPQDSFSNNIPAANKIATDLPRFKVLYTFQARNPDELTINEGDIVMVDENEDAEPGWYSGVMNGKKGWFPINYVEKLKNESNNTTSLSAVKDNLRVSPMIQPPPQSAKPNRAPSLSDNIKTGKTSAFSATTRSQDASPIPGKGEQVGDLQCRALYPWEAKKDNHLTFEKDAIIVVSEQQAMWWYGSHNGKSGWFPKAYVKEVSAASQDVGSKLEAKKSPAVKRKAPVPPKGASAALQNTSNTPSSTGKEYVASYTFTSEEEGDLNFQVGETITVTHMDGDWWTGTLNGRSGIFPANYVAVKEPESTATKQAQASTSSAVSAREIANVIAPYEATGANQLSLKMGQLVLIKKKNDTGWWEGELQVRGKKKQIGWFPANYVKIRTPGQAKAQAPAPQPAKPVLPDTLCQVMAMYDYAAQNNDEVTFSRGAIINVTDRSDPDWWSGYLKGNQDAAGLFPSNYVREIGTSGSSISPQQ